MKCHGLKTVEETLSLMQNNLLLILIIFTTGCALAATRPKKEMSYAAAAFKAAILAKAQVMSPSYFRIADFYFLKALACYRRKYFDKAKQYAELSIKFSEVAEFNANKKATFEEMDKN